MPNGVLVPRLSYEDIRKHADGFLREFHPEGSIPVPIEEIADIKLRINIIPVPGLHDAIELDGCMYGNLKDICVDEYIYSHRPARYRFTLAHEIGHIVLHRHVYETARFKSIAEWPVFLNSISETAHAWFEWQAYCFAGLVLVPAGPLAERVAEAVERVKAEGISLIENRDFAWERIAGSLAKQFEVSSTVIQKRFDYDHVREQYA